MSYIILYLCLVLPVNGSSREMERCDPNPDPKQVTGELMGVSSSSSSSKGTAAYLRQGIFGQLDLYKRLSLVGHIICGSP